MPHRPTLLAGEPSPLHAVVSINPNPQGNVYNITGVVAHGEKTERSVASEPFGAVA